MSQPGKLQGNPVGALIQMARTSRGWSFGDLARACGTVTPRETSKLSSRLVRLEREAHVHERKLPLRLARLLDLDVEKVRALLDDQWRTEQLERAAWLDEPVPLEMHVVPFGGFAYRHQLPAQCDDLEAFRLAKELTRGREQMRVIVTVSRKLAFVFQRGQLIERLEANAAPFVRIGRSFVRFEAGVV